MDRTLIEDANPRWYVLNVVHVRKLTILIGVLYAIWYVSATFYQASSEFSYEADSVELEEDDTTSPNANLHTDEMQDGSLSEDADTKKLTPTQKIVWFSANAGASIQLIESARYRKLTCVIPFLVFRVVNICILCSLTAGHMSRYLDPIDAIGRIEGMPFRDDLMKLSPLYIYSLYMLILIVALGIISMNVFVIRVVWNYYRYKCQVDRRCVEEGPHGPQENFLGDLPDYETAISDPRFGNKPPENYEDLAFRANNEDSNVMMTEAPPPSYSAAIAMASFPQNVVASLPSGLDVLNETSPQDIISVRNFPEHSVVEDQEGDVASASDNGNFTPPCTSELIERSGNQHSSTSRGSDLYAPQFLIPSPSAEFPSLPSPSLSSHSSQTENFNIAKYVDQRQQNDKFKDYYTS
ncbi:unnamed protein product [Orchesella dallaii]|uniref:Uncharacterized protein n=1 Tax=Orchesella dallaii TaxID=48710 RepID=A0ABP1PWR4_9HEXA